MSNEELMWIMKAADSIKKNCNDPIYVRNISSDLLTTAFCECVSAGAKAYLSVEGGIPSYTIESGEGKYTVPMADVNDRLMQLSEKKKRSDGPVEEPGDKAVPQGDFLAAAFDVPMPKAHIEDAAASDETGTENMKAVQYSDKEDSSLSAQDAGTATTESAPEALSEKTSDDGDDIRLRDPFLDVPRVLIPNGPKAQEAEAAALQDASLQEDPVSREAEKEYKEETGPEAEIETEKSPEIETAKDIDSKLLENEIPIGNFSSDNEGNEQKAEDTQEPASSEEPEMNAPAATVVREKDPDPAELAALEELAAQFTFDDDDLTDDEEVESVNQMPTDNLTTQQLALEKDGAVMENTDDMDRAQESFERAEPEAEVEEETSSKKESPLKNLFAGFRHGAKLEEKEEKTKKKFAALEVEDETAQEDMEPFTHPDDRGEIFKHTHELVVTMKYNQDRLIGKFKAEFWPTWVQVGSTAKTYADCLVRISNESGEEKMAIIDRSNKEYSYKFPGTEFTFKMVGVWDCGMLTTHVSIDNDSKYFLSDSVIREEPDKVDLNYLDQFKYAVKGQPKYFIVPLRRDNRGERNIPITGIAEDDGAKYILARMEGNCCKYVHNNRTRIITGHWEDGKFKITVV